MPTALDESPGPFEAATPVGVDRSDFVASVYAELRELARSLMRGQPPNHTLQPTALLHEAVLRIWNERTLGRSQDRAFVFSVAARAMRDVLVDHARKRSSSKRGGGWRRHPLDDVLDSCGIEVEELPALDEALDALAIIDERASRVVTMRFFGGFTEVEIGEELGLSQATVQRSFQFGRAWLRERLRGDVGS